jgi:hypothetical protein
MNLLGTMFAEVVSLLDSKKLLLPLSQYIGSWGNGHTTSLNESFMVTVQAIWSWRMLWIFICQERKQK